MAREHTIVFAPSGRIGRFEEGISLLDAARRLGVDLDSVCGGRGICGRCQVDLVEGEFAKHGVVSARDHATPSNAAEARYAAKRGVLREGRRLACQAKLCGDLVADVPPESQVHRQVVRKAAEARDIAVDPVVRLHYVEVREPDMHDPSSDWRRLRMALEEQWGATFRPAHPRMIHAAAAALRKGDWRVTIALREGGDVVAVWPGLRERAYGIAVDIGSTTIAAHLCDLSDGAVLASRGCMNPQIRFGDDLMSRVSYAMMNPGGDAEMTSAVRVALDELAGALADDAGLAREDIVEMTAVGNPVMHHLLLGLDSRPLGEAPFALAIDEGYDVPAAELGLALAPGAFVHVLPCIAGHVGADSAAVALAEAPWERDDLTLIVDVGTNAEIILGNRTRLLACSSPTGPAFEGAQISSGQRAAPGAIERFRVDRATLEPRYKVIGCDLWSDEPGFAEATAATGVTGLCGSGIIEAVAELFLAGVIRADGVIDPTLAERTPRIVATGRSAYYVIREGDPPVAILQTDVRAIQLAKAALHAGVKLLMDRYGATKLDRVRLAGAFGSHIDPAYAMAIGLAPDCDLDAVTSAGNAAGMGARIALLDKSARRTLADAVQRIEKIETAIEPNFQAHFVAAMSFPHSSDPYPMLRQRMELPAPADPSSLAAGRGRRRARGAES